MKPAAAQPKQTPTTARKKRLDGTHFRRKLEDNTSTRSRVRRVANQGIDTAPQLATRY
jgi:hypothetical protein